MEASVSETERKRSLVDRVRSFGVETIQWRRPALSSFYLLAVNGAFWSCVFYMDHANKFYILAGVACVLFLTCILYPLMETVTQIVPEARKIYRRWYVDEHAERNSVVNTGLALIGFFAFPIELIIFPLLKFIVLIFFYKPVQLVIMTCCSYAALHLREEHQERACWISYLTVLLMLVVPPWRSNHVTEQITSVFASTGESVWRWSNENILTPVRKFCNRFAAAIVYCVCGYWLAPLFSKIRSIFEAIASFFQRNFVGPIGRFFAFIKRQVIYYFCGHWIPPLLEYLSDKKRRFVDWFTARIVDPITRFLGRIYRFFVYWLCGHWIPPLCEWCSRQKENSIWAFRTYFVEPIVAFFSDFQRNMIYIIFGYWIPPLCSWIRLRVIDPTVRRAIRCYEMAEYIVRGGWIPGFTAYLKKRADDIKLYTIYCAVRTKNYLRDCAIRAGTHARNEWIIPFFKWQKSARVRLRVWFVNCVAKPSWQYAKLQMRRFKFYVKHHVLYPAFRRALYFVIVGIIHAWNNGVVPAFMYCKEHGERWSGYAWVHYLQPTTEWISQNLPEKSPLVDDSDTELQDFLPSENDEDYSENEDDTNEIVAEKSVNQILALNRSVEEATAALAADIVVNAVTSTLTQPGPRALIRQSISHSDASDDDDFSIGLAPFPSVENADSDEEEEKQMVPRRRDSSSSHPSARKRSTPHVRARPAIDTTIVFQSRQPKREIVEDDLLNTPTSTDVNLSQKSTETTGISVSHAVKPTTRTQAEFESEGFEMIDHDDFKD